MNLAIDDILEEVAAKNENDDSNLTFMESKIAFDNAVNIMNVEGVIELIMSQEKLIN